MNLHDFQKTVGNVYIFGIVYIEYCFFEYNFKIYRIICLYCLSKYNFNTI